MRLEPDQLVDNRYKIIEHLGEGGMGAVWKAIDIKHDDEVVIKLPLNHLDADILKRFGHEAKLMRRHSLDCPHILNIEDIGSMGEVPWYVMRYLPGGSVRDLKMDRDRKGQTQWDTTSFDWLVQIASALDYLHGNGVLHRDVKPANILFNHSGDAYLADFGIAKNPTDVTNFTQAPTAPGTSPGTFGYMAPEVLNPEPDVPAAGAVDQYALAVTLHESIAGKRPYEATNLIKLYHQTQKGCQPLRESFPDLPEAASNAVAKALSADPGERFNTCRCFADAFLAGLCNRAVDEGSTREFEQVEYREQLQREEVEGQTANRLFSSPDTAANRKRTKLHKRTWQRWLVDLGVSLVIGFGTLVTIGSLSELLPEDRIKPINYRTPWLFGIAGVAFMGSLFWRVWIVKSTK